MKSEKGPVRENPPGYEKLDARPVALLRFGAGLTILIVASLLVSHWLDEGLTPERETDNPYEPSPRPVAERTWPELQTNPYDEIDEYKKEEARRLNRYEWIDPQNGVARIPIDRARSLYLTREQARKRAAGEEPNGGGQ